MQIKANRVQRTNGAVAFDLVQATVSTHRRSMRWGATTVYWVGVLALMALVAGIGFLDVLAQRPGRTPILTLSIQYPVHQWPANAWADENTALVRELDGDVFHVRSVGTTSDGSSGPINPVDALQRSIETIDVAMPNEQPILIYLNAHMAINDRDELCLIGTDSDPREPETWHSLERFVRRYFDGELVASGRPLVFLLHCDQLRHWLPAGLIRNDIDERLARLTTEYSNHPSSRRIGWLAVENESPIIATATGEPRPWTRLICQTLSDQLSLRASNVESSASPAMGSTPIVTGGWIDSHHLQTGVQSSLDQWSRDHDDTTSVQVRWFDTGGPGPMRLAIAQETSRWVASSTDGGGTQASHPPRFDGATIDAEMEKEFDAFVGMNVAHQHPLPWIRLHRDAQRWMEVRHGGEGLAGQLAGLQHVFKSNARRLKHLAIHSTTTTDATADDAEIRGVLGEITSRATRFADAWDAIAEKPTRQTAEQTVERAAMQSCEPCPLIVAMLADRTDSAFARTKELTRFASAHAASLRIVAAIPDATFAWVRVWVDELDNARRNAVDAVLASDDALIAETIASFESSAAQLGPRIQAWSHGWHTAQRANIAVPFFWTFLLDCPHADVEPALASSFFDDWEVVSRSVQRTPTIDTLVDESERRQWKERSSRINSFLDRLELRWRQRLFASSTAASGVAPTTRRSPTERQRLNQRMAVQCFQIESSSWSASQVRQKLRFDATATMDSQQDIIPRWSRTISLQPDHLADAWVETLDQQLRRSRVGDEVERVIDDFYRGRLDEPIALFDQLATSLLAALGDGAKHDAGLEDRRRLLAERLQRCRDFIGTKSVRPIVRIEGVQLPGASMEAIAHVETDHECPVDVGGLASIQIRCDDDDFEFKRIAKSSVAWNPLPGRDRPQGFPVRLSDVQADQTLTSVLSFRGHEFVGPVQGSTHARLVSRDVTPASLPARLTVDPSPIRRRAVVFVVDASASMHEPSPIEQTRDDMATSTVPRSSKLDAARAAVMAATDRLWQREVDLGMVIYGHRVAIDSKNGTALIQKRYAARFPFSFATPAYRDVEVALPVGRFEGPQFAEMQERLKNLVPWGQSPLHLAIDAAIDDFMQAGPYQSRDIVVMTDGRNYQFNPTPDAVLPIHWVAERARAEAIRIHVVGYSDRMDSDGFEFAMTNPSLSPMTTATGGWQVAGAHDFVNGLLRGEDDRTPRFELSRQDAQGIDISTTQTIQAGQTLTLDSVTGLNERWRLSIVDPAVGESSAGLSKVRGRFQTLTLTPGDHVRLAVEETSRIEPEGLPLRRQRDANPPLVWLPMIRVGVGPTSQLGIWPTRLTDQTARFEFALSDASKLTTARPDRLWMEATALVPHSTGSLQAKVPVRYASSLVRWLPGHGVPTGEFCCEQWPRDADAFAFQVWSCNESIDRAKSLRIPEEAIHRWQDAAFPEHRFSLHYHGEKMTLTIHYPERMPAINDAMWIVEPENASLRLQAEWYDFAGRVSVHELIRIADGPKAVGPKAKRRQLLLTSVADFKRDATTTSAPHRGSVTSGVMSVSGSESSIKRR